MHNDVMSVHILSVCVYIYIYVERERVYMCIYIYIYILCIQNLGRRSDARIRCTGFSKRYAGSLGGVDV